MSKVERAGESRSYHEIARKGRPERRERAAEEPRDEVRLGSADVKPPSMSRTARQSARMAGSAARAAKPHVESAAPAGPETGGAIAPRKWTVLYYLCGNNNIARDMLVKAGRMEQTGSTDRMNIVVQTGQPAESPYPGVTRFHLAKAPGTGYDEPECGNEEPYLPLKKGDPFPQLVSKPVETLGAVDMSDPAALTDFVKWGMKSYPAEHYLVVLMDHGYGFMGTLQDDISGTVMTLPKVSAALENAQRETGKKIDVLGLDSCLMQQAEAAYELKDAAKFLVASEEVEYPFGWPEGNIVAKLDSELAKRQLSPRGVAKLIVHEGALEPEVIKTLSAVDLRKMDEVRTATDSLARALLSTDVPKDALRKIIEETHNYCTVLPDDRLCTSYRDVFDFAQRLMASPAVDDDRVKSAALSVTVALEKAIVAETHKGEGKDGSHGLATYLPADGFLPSYEGFMPGKQGSSPGKDGSRVGFETPETVYGNLAFARDTLWDEFIKSLARA